MTSWNIHRNGMPVLCAADAHRSRKGFDLDAIFSVQYKRSVTDDYTFQYGNDRYQIGKKSIRAGLRRSKIIIEHRLDDTQRVRWRQQYLRCNKIQPEKIN